MTEQNATAEVTTSANQAKLNSFAKHLQNRAHLDNDEIDGKEVAANIAMDILSANSVDDVLAANEGGLPAGKDLVDVEQRISGFDIRQGTNADIMNELTGGTFLVVHSVRLENGKPLTWQTAATNLVTALVKFEQLDAFPLDLVIKEVGGKGALAFRKVAKRTVSN